MSVTRAEVVAEARRHIGKRWRHQGRGAEVDCLGFCVAVASALGLPTADRRDYDRLPDGTLLAALATVLSPIPVSLMAPADLVVMAYDRGPSHIGLVGDYPAPGELSVIHASILRRAVVEHRLDAQTRGTIVAAFRSPLVVDA